MDRYCMNCGEKLRGRSDKKYCDELCRNNYNNRRRAFFVPEMRMVNHLLRRNRVLLEQALASHQEVRLNRQELFSRGFSFYYFTHMVACKEGRRWYGCYDIGYCAEPGDVVVIRKFQSIYANFQSHSKHLLNES